MTSAWLAVTATMTISDCPLRLVAGCWPPPLVWPEGAGVGDGWAVGAATGGRRVPMTRAFCTTSFTDPCGSPTLMTWAGFAGSGTVSYTHLRAHETRHDLVCR